MSEETPACPFCNSIDWDRHDVAEPSGGYTRCNRCNAEGPWYESDEINWITRPVEEALRSQLTAAQKELEEREEREGLIAKIHTMLLDMSIDLNFCMHMPEKYRKAITDDIMAISDIVVPTVLAAKATAKKKGNIDE